MPIINSVYTVDHPQIDGRRYVREKHTDNTGIVYDKEYLAEPNTNYDAVLAERVLQLNAYLAELEFNTLLGI